MGLPWPEWGETDVLLTMARRAIERQACQCGCGLTAKDSQDAANAARMQPVFKECHARTAIEEWREESSDDLPKGALVGVVMLPPGVPVVDPLKQAGADDHAALLDRFPHLRGSSAGSS